MLEWILCFSSRATAVGMKIYALEAPTRTFCAEILDLIKRPWAASPAIPLTCVCSCSLSSSSLMPSFYLGHGRLAGSWMSGERDKFGIFAAGKVCMWAASPVTRAPESTPGSARHLGYLPASLGPLACLGGRLSLHSSKGG